MQKLKLKKLVPSLLGYEIQVGEHCPAEDAQAAMQIYKKFQIGWDDFLSRKPESKKHYEPPSYLPSIIFKFITLLSYSNFILLYYSLSFDQLSCHVLHFDSKIKYILCCAGIAKWRVCVP